MLLTERFLQGMFTLALWRHDPHGHRLMREQRNGFGRKLADYGPFELLSRLVEILAHARDRVRVQMKAAFTALLVLHLRGMVDDYFRQDRCREQLRDGVRLELNVELLLSFAENLTMKRDCGVDVERIADDVAERGAFAHVFVPDLIELVALVFAYKPDFA